MEIRVERPAALLAEVSPIWIHRGNQRVLLRSSPTLDLCFAPSRALPIRVLLDEDEPGDSVFRREMRSVPAVFTQASADVVGDSDVREPLPVAEDVKPSASFSSIGPSPFPARIILMQAVAHYCAGA